MERGSVEELVGISGLKVDVSLEGAGARCISVFVDVGVKEVNDVVMDSKCNFNAVDKGVEKVLVFR